MKSCPVCRKSYPADFTVCPRDASPLVEAGVWSEGAVLRGRYRILGKVGEGGMGTVYKAEHTHFQELRALKVMRADLATDPTFVSRFHQEAVISRRLQHPNAVRVEDIDEAEDGRPFIVMEFIEGRSLKDVIRNEAPMAVGRVSSILRQTAGALDAAHSLGIVHRDIKPANIVLIQTTGGEQVKVLDFGIAKLKEGYLQDRAAQPTLTGTGMVVGTPAYISPEQAFGKRGQELDGRADLYSLAIVAFQMLTGDLPFKAESDIGFAMAHLQMQPPSLRDRRPDIPPAFADVIMRCLEKKPELRPASAREMAEELELAESGFAGNPFSPPPSRVPTVSVTPVHQRTNLNALADLPTATLSQPQIATTALPRNTPPSKAELPKDDPRKAKSRELYLYLGVSAVVLILLGIAARYVFFEQTTDVGAPASTEQQAPLTPGASNGPDASGNSSVKTAPDSAGMVPAIPPPSPTPPGSDRPSFPSAANAPAASGGSSQPIHLPANVSDGLLIQKVQPDYPQLARTARVQGTVILTARINKEGNVDSLQLISGHPLLAPAAIDAVKKWRYKPYVKNGRPVAVETQIQVNFKLTNN